jgi:NhaP-type Na+/H+ and K+/H+ antiporter
MIFTKRREVNGMLAANVEEFIVLASEVIKGTKIVNDANYDLREISTQKAVDLLKITVDSTQVIKKNWLLIRKSIDSTILHLDWYINRCNIDLKKYREKLNGETQNIPRDELPDWEN